MHNNYHFLDRLTADLQENLIGSVCTACFTQEKNELILKFVKGDQEQIIRAHLLPDFSCLSFPDEHHRARKNTVDLLPEIIGRTVDSLHCHLNERAFTLCYDSTWCLTFKMFGNRSNIILFRFNEVHTLFRSGLRQDKDLHLDALDREIDFSYESFAAVNGSLTKFMPTLGKLPRRYLYEHGFGEMDMRSGYEATMNLADEMKFSPIYINQVDGSLVLTLFPIGQARSVHDNPIDALNTFFHTYIRENHLGREKRTITDRLHRELEKSLRYIDKSEQRLLTLKTETNFREIADLIMANLHNIPAGSSRVEVEDFYHSNVRRNIKLKPDQTPQRNAENYYRKAKNQHLEVAKLEENIRHKKEAMKVLQEKLKVAESADTLKELRKIDDRETGEKRTKSNESVPYHVFMINDFKIWLGKSGKANDRMLQHCHKDDLWLHAKDVPGAHVIVKFRSESGFPDFIKEKAAQLAAFHSKRKNDTLCPVIVTPRKFVRKRKGSPPGAVVVDREMEVILVEPANWSTA